MLPPDYLPNQLSDITVVFADLHTAILTSIAKHVADTLRATGELGLMPSTAKQIEDAQAAGLLREDIEKHIAESLAVTLPEVRALFEDAAIKNSRYDSEAYRDAGLDPIPINQSPTSLRILQAGINKQMGSIRRLTGTIAVNSEDLFERTLNTAYSKVVAGTHSYTDALNEGIDEMVREGINTFSYANQREISVEAALLANIRTGVAQTAGEITRQGLVDMGCSYVQVSAHQGARIKGEGHQVHADWQGKFYYYSEIATEPNTYDYDDFVKICGYGLVDGILGANCRHHFGPAYPGVTQLRFTAEQIDALNGKTVTFKDPKTGEEKEIPMADAQEHLRYLERSLREWKKRLAIKQAVGLDATLEKRKVKEWSGRIRGFTESAGLRRQYSRERIAKP